MDETISEECSNQGLNLDFELIKSEFEKNPNGAADNHVVETLFTILDFQRFKELMVAYNKKDEIDTTVSTTTTLTNDTNDIDVMVDSLISDGKVLLDSKDSDIWKIHTKVSDSRVAYQSTSTESVQSKLKLMNIKNKIWKFDIILPNIQYDKIKKF